MSVTAVSASLLSVKADASAVFIFHDKKLLKEKISSLGEILHKNIFSGSLLNDFTGKEGDVAVLYTEGLIASPRLLLVGLGEKKDFSLERVRRAAANAAKKARALKLSYLALEFPLIEAPVSFPTDSIAKALTEGALLSLYKFDKYLTKEKDDKKIDSIVVFSNERALRKEIDRGVKTGSILSAATIRARDLANAPGNEIYPESLARIAQQAAKEYGFSATVYDKRKIEALKFGGVLGVSKGSEKSPRFIVLEYNRAQKKRGTVVLVGKGVTFDTGGISIKPSANMAEMKMDMSGAAAVIGAFQAIAQLNVPVHVVGLIPAVENMPGGAAVKPGDIIRHYNGKTSEVDNTDAEGRLILADALGYASKFKPDLVIDLATLTGAVVVALGHFATGMMGNHQPSMDAMKNAGEETYERVWQLPLFDEYEKLIKSDVADVKNTGGRWGGAITAGWFLKKFIGEYRWMHLDIAGTAILEENQEYIPKGGSGVGVRLLVEFLRNWKKH